MLFFAMYGARSSHWPSKAFAPPTPSGPDDVRAVARGELRRERVAGALVGDVVEDEIDVRMRCVEVRDDLVEDLERARIVTAPRQQNHLIVTGAPAAVGAGVTGAAEADADAAADSDAAVEGAVVAVAPTTRAEGEGHDCQQDRPPNATLHAAPPLP